MSADTSRLDASLQAAKRARREPPKPQELQKGTKVTYGPGKQGVVRDAYVPLDEFWLTDLVTGQVVRDEEGHIQAFKSKQLKLISEEPTTSAKPATSHAAQAPVAVASAATKGSAARVLLLGTETHMRQILERFGDIDYEQRKDPQILLAIPVDHAKSDEQPKRYDPEDFIELAAEGIDDDMYELARRLRPDLEPTVRAVHLKQALEQIGPDIKSLEGYFCLSSVLLPYGTQEIEEADGEERRYREEVRCQIDLGVSAMGSSQHGEASPEETAARALLEYCGVHLAPSLWSEKGQFNLRQTLGVDLPMKFWDSSTKVFVVVLPKDAYSFTRDSDGALCYRVADDASQSPAPVNNGSGPVASQPAGTGKSVGDWKQCQDEFKHLGPLPKPWIFIRSSSNKDIIYYLNTETQKTTMERPLPPGWTKQTSKSTGKTYYFHAQKRKSMFEIPPPD